MNNQNGTFKNKSFTQVSNTAIRDTSLTNRARGLYAFINSYITAPNFKLHKTHLIKNSVEGLRAFNTAWKELKDRGYLKQYRIRTADNKFIYEYELLDEPDTETPSLVNIGLSGKPTSSNIPQNSGNNDDTFEVQLDTDSVETNDINEQKTKKNVPHTKRTWYKKNTIQTVSNIVNTKVNNTDFNNTNINNQSIRERIESVQNDSLIEKQITAEEYIERMDTSKEVIYDNINYGEIISMYPQDKSLIDNIIDAMLHVIMTKKSHIKISGDIIPTEILRSQMFKINEDDIEYLRIQLGNNNFKIIKNPLNYIIACLHKVKQQSKIFFNMVPAY